MKIAFLMLALLCAAGPGSAATVTFNHPTYIKYNNGALVYEGEGFRFMTSAAYEEPGTITLHDDAGITMSTIKPVRGGVFTPLSILLQGWSKIARTGSGPAPDYEEDWAGFKAWTVAGSAKIPSLQLTGLFASGRSVSQIVAPLPGISPTKFEFGSEFAGIRKLSLTILYPPTSQGTMHYGYFQVYDREYLSKPDTDWCYEYCAEVIADDLVVSDTATVPVPAAGMMLLAALLGLGTIRQRRH